jgi:hypothetical protein
MASCYKVGSYRVGTDDDGEARSMRLAALCLSRSRGRAGHFADPRTCREGDTFTLIVSPQNGRQSPAQPREKATRAPRP